jgi:hypothetical protein
VTGGPGQPTWRRAGAGLVLAATLLASTGTAVPGLAQPAGTTGDPDPSRATGVFLVAQDLVVESGTPFTVDLRVSDTTAATTLEVTVHSRVTTRIGFAQTIDGLQLGEPLARFPDLPVDTLPEVAPDTRRLSLPVEAEVNPGAFPAVVLPEPGVYPLSVRRNDTADALVSYLVRPEPRDPDAPPGSGANFGVALVVSWSAPPEVDADGTPVVDAADATRLAGQAAALADTPTVPLTLAVEPATLDAMASRDPGDDTGSVTALASAGESSQVLGLPWVPVDTNSLVANGLEEFLDSQRQAGGATIARRLGTTPGWGTVILTPTTGPGALAALRARGVTRAVVPEELTSPLDATEFPVTLTQLFDVVDVAGESIPAVQADRQLAELFVSSDQPALVAARVVADLALLARDRPQLRRAAAVIVPPGTDPEALAAVLTGIAAAAAPSPQSEPVLEAQTLDGLFAATSAATGANGDVLVRPWTTLPAQDLTGWALQLAATNRSTEALASTLLVDASTPDADATLAGVGRLTLASGWASLDAEGRSQYLDAASTATREALAPIGLPEQGTVNLTSDQGVVPVAVVNGRSEPVRVLIEVTSDRLDFPEGSSAEAVLVPGTNREELAVTARASGGVPVEVTVRTADGATLLGEARFIVRSSAVSGLGVVLSLLAGLFLVVWWARNFRRTRKRRQLVDADPPR